MMASADAVEIDGIYYNLITKAKEAEVTYNPNHYSGDVVIPETVKYEGVTYNVKSIGYRAFIECKNMTSITIPSSITYIGQEAFWNCNGLTAVYISDIAAWCSITYYSSLSSDKNPLYYAHKLYLNGEEVKDLVIPDGVTFIGSYAFYSCESLTSVTLPNSVTSIGSCAFALCNMTSFTIPSSITSIGSGAFQWSSLTAVYISDLSAWCNIDFEGGISNPLSCANHLYLNGTEIKDLVIPSDVTSIGDNSFYNYNGLNSFYNYNGLTSVTIPNSVTKIGKYAFSGCSGLTSVIIPNSVTFIDKRAFDNCSSLTSVTIGSGVSTINDAFSKCIELTDVYCYAKDVPYTQYGEFTDSYIEYATLHVPAGSIEKYKDSNIWGSFKEIVKIDMPEHTLTYKVDGEVYKTYTIEDGETITREPAPTKEGYTFSGWSEIPETMPAEDVTVTGTFTINKYKLTYMVDGEVYKTYEVKYGSTIIPESEPTKENCTFSGWSEIPEEMPAKDVIITGKFIKQSLGKCATPTINADGGKLSFSCETEGVDYFYEITNLDSKKGSGNEVNLTNTYVVTVYATKEGYDQSDTAQKEIQVKGGKPGDANGDGVVNAADVVKTVNIIMGN